MDKDKVFNEVWNEFLKKDYFNTEVAIKNEIERRDKGKEQGQNVSQYTDEFIREFVIEKDRNNIYERVFKPLDTAIETNDIEELKKRLRYDQKFTIALYSRLTGNDITKFTNKKIKDFIERGEK